MPKLDTDGVALTISDKPGRRRSKDTTPIKFPTRVWEPSGIANEEGDLTYCSRPVTTFDRRRRQVVSDWLAGVITVEDYRIEIAKFGYYL